MLAPLESACSSADFASALRISVIFCSASAISASSSPSPLASTIAASRNVISSLDFRALAAACLRSFVSSSLAASISASRPGSDSAVLRADSYWGMVFACKSDWWALFSFASMSCAVAC